MPRGMVETMWFLDTHATSETASDHHSCNALGKLSILMSVHSKLSIFSVKGFSGALNI